MTNEIVTRRLSIIKHLFNLGIEQSFLPDTISYTSILSMHDSIDMFMNLSAEKRGLFNKKGLYLMEYFDVIPGLTLKPSVAKINKRRNALKHDGIIPGKVEIQDTCSIAGVFFEENTKIIFDRDFNSISLFDLISYEDVRAFLKEADECIKKNNLEGAAISIAKAYFHLLLHEDSLNRTDKRNPFYQNDGSLVLLREGKFYTKAHEIFFEGQDKILNEPKTEDGYVEISEGVAAMSGYYNKSFGYIFETLNILKLGLDYRKFNFFNSFMPVVISLDTNTNKYNIGKRVIADEQLLNKKENLIFALDFVMEFALKVQEFKY